MSFLCCWLALSLVQCLFLQLVDSAPCKHDAVYVTGPSGLTGSFRVNTPGDKSGTAHSNRPIFESVGNGAKNYLYYADGYWIFGKSQMGGEEEYFSPIDEDCPDVPMAEWFTPGGMDVPITISQVASEGMCPQWYPHCEKGDCRTGGGIASLTYAPNAETEPSVGDYTAIHGSSGVEGTLGCNQHFKACPSRYPICAESNSKCVIAECEAGFGIGKHSACVSEHQAASSNTAPWRCTDPWRCLPEDRQAISSYNFIEGFDGNGEACSGSYEVRMCPKEKPMCKDGNCVIEECKDGCVWSSENQISGFDGSGNTCNRNYEVRMCPKSYPVCSSNNCLTPGTHASLKMAPHPGIVPGNGNDYNAISGYDAKGVHCDDSYQVEATCPEKYPVCLRGSCRTERADPAHPVWAMYYFTEPDTCTEKSAQPCNAIHGYDGLGAKCDQDYQACPALYPYCDSEVSHNCLIAECRLGGCSSPNLASSRSTKPANRYTGISGFDTHGTHCRGDYKMRRCPDDYPACYQGDCVIESCKPGPSTISEPCTWKAPFVNPLLPDQKPPPPGSRYTFLLGNDGLGNICNEGFEVECPTNYPVCVDGNCVITKCKDGIGRQVPCAIWMTAENPTVQPWPASQFNQLNGNGLEGKKKCTMDYEVAMCPLHYPTCVDLAPIVLAGESDALHGTDCMTKAQLALCKGGGCGAWKAAPHSDTDPADQGYSYIAGNDAWGTPCNHDYEEVMVTLLASKQDLLHWLTDEKAWHTSIQIGDTESGTEYWYDPENGGTIKEEPAGQYTSHADRQSGLVPKGDKDKVTIYEIRLGPTSKSARVMKRELEKLFILPDNGYDIIYRNSNTFTDFALWTLLGYRLSVEWVGDDPQYSSGPIVENLLEAARIVEPGSDRFEFQKAEAKVRTSEHGAYGQIKELFNLLGQDLERKRWYEMYICPKARGQTEAAWANPVLRPKKGFAAPPDEEYPQLHTIEEEKLPIVLGRGGANEHTKADSVVPADLRSFLKLVDLLMANCVSLLYKEQVKVAEQWYNIDHSEPFNPLSALDKDTQKIKLAEKVAKWQTYDSEWRDSFGENSHQAPLVDD